MTLAHDDWFDGHLCHKRDAARRGPRLSGRRALAARLARRRRLPRCGEQRPRPRSGASARFGEVSLCSARVHEDVAAGVVAAGPSNGRAPSPPAPSLPPLRTHAAGLPPLGPARAPRWIGLGQLHARPRDARAAAALLVATGPQPQRRRFLFGPGGCWRGATARVSTAATQEERWRPPCTHGLRSAHMYMCMHMHMSCACCHVTYERYVM